MWGEEINVPSLPCLEDSTVREVFFRKNKCEKGSERVLGRCCLLEFPHSPIWVWERSPSFHPTWDEPGNNPGAGEFSCILLLTDSALSMPISMGIMEQKIPE